MLSIFLTNKRNGGGQHFFIMLIDDHLGLAYWNGLVIREFWKLVSEKNREKSGNFTVYSLLEACSGSEG